MQHGIRVATQKTVYICHIKNISKYMEYLMIVVYALLVHKKYRSFPQSRRYY